MIPGMVIQTHAETQHIYQAAAQNYWSRTHFFLEVDENDPAPSPVQHLNPQNLSHVTRVEFRSSRWTPLFSYDRGIWTCLGRCCNSSNTRQHYRHPRKAVTFTSTLWIPHGNWDQTLVHRVHTVGPNMSGLTGSPRQLRVAELHQSVPVDNTTAHRAVGKPMRLSVQELMGVLGWYRSALYRYSES